MDAEAVDEAELLADPPPNFGELLRSRREEAQLSIAALAAKAGVSRNTIVNLEKGGTAPSPLTLRRLVAVKALRLQTALSADRQKADAWFTTAYDPLAMTHQMTNTLNGPGGQLDQTYLYLDPQSAADWHALSNDSEYVRLYRSQAPLAKLAERINKEARGAGIDIDALGCGDGKTETTLVSHIADLAQGTKPDLQLYLVDISHVLLTEAYRTAMNALAPRGIPVHPIHGDLHDIAKNPILYHHPESLRRLRVFLMMGYTLGNIRHEPWFFRDLAACAQPGDLAVLDFGLTRAPADQPHLIQEIDPAIRAKKPANIYRSFLSGPLNRHIQGCSSIKLRIELSTDCPVPGSYAIENWATVKVEHEQDRQFLMFLVKRYDLAKLSEFLFRLGWQMLQSWKYGPDALAAVMLLKKL